MYAYTYIIYIKSRLIDLAALILPNSPYFINSSILAIKTEQICQAYFGAQILIKLDLLTFPCVSSMSYHSDRAKKVTMHHRYLAGDINSSLKWQEPLLGVSCQAGSIKC